MANFKFVLNKDGVRELLKSQEMMEICKTYASSALATLGDGYSVNSYTGANRVNTEITADTYAARKDNSENNSILKSLGG